MRYMLTGDHWNAEEAFRIGVVQELLPRPIRESIGKTKGAGGKPASAA